MSNARTAIERAAAYVLLCMTTGAGFGLRSWPGWVHWLGSAMTVVGMAGLYQYGKAVGRSEAKQ